MTLLSEPIDAVQSGRADPALAALYGGENLPRQRARYSALLDKFAGRFPDHGAVALFSAPGRTEVGGNHTDHNAGRVLAAAVNLDAISAAAPRPDSVIRVNSEGYGESTVDTGQLSVVEDEKGTVAALVRGVCAGLAKRGYRIGGFDACVTSDVLKGSGLSSSAAFEMLMVTTLNHLYNHGNIDPIDAAQIGQYAENAYFGKPCGLMDQVTSALGGFVTIDFRDTARPAVRKLAFDFATSGHALVIVDTGGDHADLTADYAAVRQEMQAVAAAFGAQVLREVSAEQVLANIPFLRAQAGDRAILRALHFFSDDQRVVEQVEALEAGDFGRFLQLVIESGRSSWMLLQNCYQPSSARSQGVTLGLALTERRLQPRKPRAAIRRTMCGAPPGDASRYGIWLGGQPDKQRAGLRRGAWRVHGGGFAGTIQAFVPRDLLQGYLAEMRAIFGESSCHELSVRAVGATAVEAPGVAG